MDELFWPLALLGVGLGLLIAEVFLPSGGILGILAAASLLTSAYLASTVSVTFATRWLLAEAVLIPAAWVAALYGLPRTRLGRQVYLRPPSDAELESRDVRSTQPGRVGDPCRALTPLRPSGMVEMDGRRIEAMAETGLIAAGAAVTVVAIRSGRVIVRAE